ncbi:HAMP domain-containing sensor histidine kinase [Nodosilinea sp. FACHB-13]|uniref:sensor histidine kinase n=1 Tax=Cyanophyceae TaxID=3028117 RepID=UPI001683ABB8|nr:HAMP domain-containing sensor histidine kinase [Nodosilinea sp. FACHB-13]MBD2107530.1 HAMP domain-containing histidine kinase [Nodosilinea sp. FACHB-13]
MVDRPIYPSPHQLRQVPQLSILWITGGLFTGIILLELISSADYVFSYLYIGPILLATLRLSSRFAFRLTLLASFLTLFNLWIPGSHIITPYTIGNRIIAVAAIVVAGVLSHRNRSYEEAIAQQQTKLQLQEQLATFRENFVSTLTHDLKTPLLGAIETLEAFQQERFGRVTEAQQQVLATMMRSQKTSLQLVETVLDIYRNDAEGVQLRRSPVNLVELIEQVVHTLNDLASSYRVSISFSPTAIAAEACWVDGDCLQLHRVVSNLLINAIYHSPIDGRVDVVLESWQDSEPNQQVVKVLDEGLGIRPEELPQLFERFYQGCSDRQAKGSGLGLYLSRQIIEAHGGTIWAENRVPCGAVFGFSLPASYS